jgi:hypothetical protein
MRHGRLITTAIAAVAAMAIGPAGALAAPATFTDDDFAGGTGANTVVSSGAVQLARGTVTEPFDGTSSSLPTGWTATPWAMGGTATLVGGTLEISGARVNSARTFSTAPGTQVLQFEARFAGTVGQHVGFGDVSTGPFAIISTSCPATPGGDHLCARTLGPGGSSENEIAGFVAGALHTYRIEWSAGSVKYYVDDILAFTQNVAVPSPQPVVMSDFDIDTATLRIDSLSQNLFLTPGSLVSRVFDAGSVYGTWGAMTAQSTVPTGTGLILETRSSNDASSWSDFQPLGPGGAIQSPVARYIQYRATLTAADNSLTPSLDSVTMGYEVKPPATGGGSSGGTGGTGGTGGSGTSGGGNSATDKTAPKVTFAAKSLRASKKGTVSFTVGCPATESSCTVKVTLKNGRKSVASKTVTVKGGKTKTVTLTLSSAAKKLLAKRHSLKVSSVVTATDAAGNHRTTTKKFTLRRAG